MPRFQPVRHETGSEEQRQLLDAVKHKLGRVPNVLATLANAPAALRMYLGAGEALAGGRISPTLREKIALAVAEANGCEYCLAAHSAVGKSLGLSPDEIVRNRRGESEDAHTAAALGFARAVVEKRGWVDDEDVAVVRSAGFDDAGILEIIVYVALNTFTNYVNHVALTEIDFPKAEALASH